LGVVGTKEQVSFFYTLNGDYFSIAQNKVLGEYFPAISINGYDIDVYINLGYEKYLFDWGIWKDINHIMSKYDDCLYNQLCTFSGNGYIYFAQKVYHCKTCNFVAELGVCEVCATKCHEGHDIRGPEYSEGFFCDCGEQTYKKIKNCCKSLPDDIEKLIENLAKSKKENN